MIVTVCSESSSLNPFFVCYRKTQNNREKICEIHNLIQGNEQIFQYNFSDGKIESLYFSLFSKKAKELKAGLSTFEKPKAYFILDSYDNCIGKIVIKINKLKKHLLFSYYSFIYTYKNKTYEIYEIGFGHNGQYYVVYENGINIAIIERRYATSYDDTAYVLYSLRDDVLELLHLVSYWYLDREYNYESHSSMALITPYKEIKEKYDPTFIPKIKAMEEIDV